MNLQRFEPLNLINVLNRDFNRFPVTHAPTPATDWIPAVDILEEKDRFVLRADLPGVSVDDIDVTMEDGQLSVSGERVRESSEASEGVRRFERRVGKFVRRFSLPDSADADNITARNVNGVLEIVIPKQAEVDTTRRITVEAA